MKKIWDCVIIGAGPSGSSAAISCAKVGLSVLLIDKSDFPRDKVCGCCLNEKSVSALKKLRAFEQIETHSPVKLDNLNLTIADRNFDIPLAGRGIAISRNALDMTLVNKAKEMGVSCLFSTKAKVGPLINYVREIELEEVVSGTESLVHTRYLIVATGLAYPKLFIDPIEQKDFQPEVSKHSYIGIGTRVSSKSALISKGEIRMYVKRFGYVGITTLEDGSIDIAGAIAPHLLKGPKSVFDSIREIVPANIIHDSVDLEEAEWTGTLAMTRKRNIEIAQTYAVGDAVAYVEPFTGEGIGWALESGILIAEHLKYGKDSSSHSWNNLWEKNIGRKMLNCHLVSQSLRHPNITSAMLKTIFAVPGTKRYLSKLLSHGGSVYSQ